MTSVDSLPARHLPVPFTQVVAPVSLSVLASAQLERGAPRRQRVAPATLECSGLVLLPDGGPAVGAVVVSNAGGQAITRADGRFELELELAPDAVELEVTAVAN